MFGERGAAVVLAARNETALREVAAEVELCWLPWSSARRSAASLVALCWVKASFVRGQRGQWPCRWRGADHVRDDLSSAPAARHGVAVRGRAAPPGVAQAGDWYAGRRGARRSDPDEGRAARRERPAAPAARGPPPPGHAARAHPRGPPPPHPPGAPGARLASRAPHRAAGHAAALAPPRVPPRVAGQVRRGHQAAAGVRRDGRADPAAGRGEPAVGRRAHPRGTPQARPPGRQTHRPAPHARGAAAAATGGRADLGHLRPQPRRRDLGLRLPPGHRPAVPVALRVLRRRPRLPPGGPRRRHAAPHRRLGGAAAARGDAVRGGPALPAP